MHEIFWNTEVFPNEIFRYCVTKSLRRKNLIPPSLMQKIFRYPEISDTPKCSPTKFFGTVRQKILNEKSFACNIEISGAIHRHFSAKIGARFLPTSLNEQFSIRREGHSIIRYLGWPTLHRKPDRWKLLNSSSSNDFSPKSKPFSPSVQWFSPINASIDCFTHMEDYSATIFSSWPLHFKVRPETAEVAHTSHYS